MNIAARMQELITRIGLPQSSPASAASPALSDHPRCAANTPEAGSDEAAGKETAAEGKSPITRIGGGMGVASARQTQKKEEEEVLFLPSLCIGTPASPCKVGVLPSAFPATSSTPLRAACGENGASKVGKSGSAPAAPDCGAPEQRWGRVPYAAGQLSAVAPVLSPVDAVLFREHFEPQPGEVRDWLTARESAYLAARPRWPLGAHIAAAQVDLLLWQWEDVLPAHVAWWDKLAAARLKLHGLAEARRYFAAHPASPRPPRPAAPPKVDQSATPQTTT